MERNIYLFLSQIVWSVHKLGEFAPTLTFVRHARNDKKSRQYTSPRHLEFIGGGETSLIKIKNENSDREAKVLAQHICMSVFKARRVIDLIRGPANASHNMGLNEAEVNRGAIVKKFRPRARGRSYMRKKQLAYKKRKSKF
ncbi:hypothetical protein IEQ34_023173 [Dendrobium chrysotoxum]|uniref:50S ribosomal protein L22, chloroplastic n=1 Tax=Dendrobium chrysotoxum TaxID=161865 RepID=A0AAV7FJW1_DENCH|nr:hypothetical protein IEQ34_023173 [Dendrobium chrysotoxum]